MKTLVGFLFLLAILVPIYNYETDRYIKTFDKCNEQYDRNMFTLNQPVCIDVDKREKASKEMRNACIIAQSENNYDPVNCARDKWWKESSIMNAYVGVTGFVNNVWIMYSLICIAIVVGIYSYFSHRTAIERDKVFIKGMDQMFRRTNNLWNEKAGKYLRLD